MTADLDDFLGAYSPDFKYRLDNELMLKAYAARVEARVRAARPRRVLSLGIGHRIVSGRLVALLEEGVVGEYTVVEGSETLASRFRQEARPRRGSLEIVRARFEEYVASAPFYAVEMGFVLEHVEDPALVLARFRDSLAPAGMLFVAVPNARSLHRRLGQAAGLLPDLHALSEFDRQLGHRRYFDLATVTRMVEGAGYRITARHGLVLKPLTTQQLLDVRLPPDVWDAFIQVGYDLPDAANAIYLEATR